MNSRARLALALLLPFLAAGGQWALRDPWIKPYVCFHGLAADASGRLP
jgi:hypothetical protein